MKLVKGFFIVLMVLSSIAVAVGAGYFFLFVKPEQRDQTYKVLRGEDITRVVEVEKMPQDEWTKLKQARSQLEAEQKRFESEMKERKRTIQTKEAELEARDKQLLAKEEEFSKRQEQFEAQKKAWMTAQDDQRVRANVRRFAEMEPKDVAEILVEMSDEDIKRYLAKMPADVSAPVIIELKKIWKDSIGQKRLAEILK